jgi:hypothetical protein
MAFIMIFGLVTYFIYVSQIDKFWIAGQPARRGACYASTAWRCCAGHGQTNGLEGLGWLPAPLITPW